MDSFIAVLLFSCAVFIQISGEVMDDETFTKDEPMCYSCSGKSLLCQDSVYDYKHLTRVPCSTKCFLRVESNEIYRGCFDGWVGGIVKSNYEGCRIQKYLGQEVEWCFCSRGGSKGNGPCNGRSRGELGSNMKMPSPYDKMKGGVAGVVQYAKASDGLTYSLQAHPQQYNGYSAGKVTYGMYNGPPTGNELGTKSKPSPQMLKKFIGDNLGSAIEEAAKQLPDGDSAAFAFADKDRKKLVECYECHDGSEYCKKRVTKPDFMAIKGCKTKCFLRMERNRIYRGCFDGWMSTTIIHNYIGCKAQNALGSRAQWCFCRGHLCNGASMAELERGSSVIQAGLPTGAQLQGGQGEAVLSATAVAKEGNYEKDSTDYYYDEDYYNDNSFFAFTPARKLSPKTMCRGLPNGVYTDPFDCKMYVNCLNGYTYRRKCPPGTGWNPDAGFCDYAYKVEHMCQALDTYPNEVYTDYGDQYRPYTNYDSPKASRSDESNKVSAKDPPTYRKPDTTKDTKKVYSNRKYDDYEYYDNYPEQKY